MCFSLGELPRTRPPCLPPTGACMIALTLSLGFIPLVANPGTCKLCMHERKLIRAHVIPRSFFKLDPEERMPAQLLTNVAGRYAQQVRIGVYDSDILCEECEHRFSPWDDYGTELLLQKWDTFETVKESDGTVHASILPSFDYPRLKLFFLSVLWRASVSNHSMYQAVDLGPREPELRRRILDSDPGAKDDFGVVLQAFDQTNVGMLNPGMERFDGLRFCRIYLSHVIAFIKTDQRPFHDPFDSIALAPGGPLVVIKKDFARSPERRIMSKLVIEDQARRQARRNPNGERTP